MPPVEDSPPEQIIIGGADETIRNVEKHLKPPIVTIVLNGNAEVHRFTQAGDHVGFLMANTIIFEENTGTGDRTHTIAEGKVKFLRNNIYITSDSARQNHKTEQITFKGDVEIINVQISVDHVKHEFRDLIKGIRDLIKRDIEDRKKRMEDRKRDTEDPKKDTEDPKKDTEDPKERTDNLKKVYTKVNELGHNLLKT